jgi:hypothetical protein
LCFFYARLAFIFPACFVLQDFCGAILFRRDFTLFEFCFWSVWIIKKGSDIEFFYEKDSLIEELVLKFWINEYFVNVLQVDT